jgi:hypothetical protein
MSGKDAAAAMEWVRSIADENIRLGAMAQAVGQWAKSDPVAAARRSMALTRTGADHS